MLGGAAVRRRAISELFESVEKKFGDVSALSRETGGINPVLTTPTLTRGALQDLFEHRIVAVRVPNFFPAPAASALATELKTHSGTRNWKVSTARGLESSDVQSVGTPHNVALSEGPEAVDKYFEESVQVMRQMRELQMDKASGVPCLSPIDKLRLELDETWPHGATVSKNKNGQPYLAGMGRIMHGPTKWMDGFCHVDDLGIMTDSAGLFSANIYLETPTAPADKVSIGGSDVPLVSGKGGGELLIWDLQIRNRWEFYSNAFTLSRLIVQDTEGQARLREKFPPPLRLVPEVGELILLCAQRPHAVNGFSTGTRISMQSFLNHTAGKPIQLDS
jgi:hypothetical protein